MRFLLINQFYPPDVAPTGRFLHDLARTLVERGHEVRVWCSRRAYAGSARFAREETLDGVRIHRALGPATSRGGHARRVLPAAAFLLLAGLRVLRERPRPDLVLALTSPPFLGAVVAAAARLRRLRHAHWVMDVYPDVLAAHGLLRGGSAFDLMLRALSRRALRGAGQVVALGPFMEHALSGSTGPARLDSVELWGEDEPGDEARLLAQALRRERADGRDCVLLYSGNLGLGHRFGEFLGAAGRLGASGPAWTFAGDGPRRDEVARAAAAHPEAGVRLVPYVPRERLAQSLLAADVHLASLSRPWQGLIAPSKVQAAFSLGRPVLFVGPSQNESAAWILESGGGWVIAEDDVEGLLAAVAAARDPKERERRGAAARLFARRRFDRRANCGRLAGLLERAAG